MAKPYIVMLSEKQYELLQELADYTSQWSRFNAPFVDRPRDEVPPLLVKDAPYGELVCTLADGLKRTVAL